MTHPRSEPRHSDLARDLLAASQIADDLERVNDRLRKRAAELEAERDGLLLSRECLEARLRSHREAGMRLTTELERRAGIDSTSHNLWRA